MTHTYWRALGWCAAGLVLSVQTRTIVEYALPRSRAFPHDPAVGRDGIVWYTDQANSYIGRLDPANGKVTDYPTPTPASGPHGIIVAPDGAVWYTANFQGRIGRLDPASVRSRSMRCLPKRATLTRRSITLGRSGLRPRGRTSTARSTRPRAT